MKQFRFRLDPVLRWRSTQAAQEQAKLERLLAEQHRLEASQRMLEEEARGSRNWQCGHTTVMGSEFQTIARYMVGVQARQLQLADQMRHTRDRITNQQQRCLEAERKVELLEKLKDTHRALQERALDQELQSLAEDAFRAKCARER